jgi:hypothetical protein
MNSEDIRNFEISKATEWKDVLRDAAFLLREIAYQLALRNEQTLALAGVQPRSRP